MVEARRSQFDAASRALMLLDPARVLERGYSIVEHRGAVLHDARQVAAGDHLHLRLARGTLEASVTSATAAASESEK
jgi:exodeoxyribonuclease VII large subunit